MKIAMIGHKRIPSREGGVEIVVEELATRLAAQGHTVDVYNRIGRNKAKNKSCKEKRPKEYKGVHLIWTPTINKKCLDATIYSLFATISALFRHYDIIHFHSEGPCVMIFLPHLFHIHTVATIHGLDWQRSKWGGFGTWYIHLGEKMAVKYADEIIVLSKNIQNYFMENYGRQTRYIPNGVSIPIKRKADLITKKYGLHKDDYILFLARLVPEKGVHYLLEAFKQIKTNKKLVIAGGTSHSNDYVKMITDMAKSDSRVIMTGFVEGKELEELFSNCYLYVLPSDVEGMPISLLEAMSYGCKCLVSDINENVEVIGKMGTTFRKSNINSLIDALKQCLQEEKKDGYIEVSRYVSKKYNWDKVLEQTTLLY